MLHDLDQTLDALLREEQTNILIGSEGVAIDISFDPPNSQTVTQFTSPTLNCFLYDIQENLDRREGTSYSYVRDRDRGVATVQNVPLRVDCSYLLSIWINDSAPNPGQREHQLLGLVMQRLLYYRQLPNHMLRGQLRDQELPVRTQVLHPSGLGSIGEFWSAMGIPLKVALNYTVTIAVPMMPVRDTIPLVTNPLELHIESISSTFIS